MAKYFGTGVPLSTGFDLSSKRPLDSRQCVESIEARDSMADIQKYQGMIVFVESTKLTYQLIDNEWVVFGTNIDTVLENLHKVATTGNYYDLENVPNTQIVASSSEPSEEEKVMLWLDITEVTE
jgi:hypothetical protein